jgi:hypothetical protein
MKLPRLKTSSKLWILGIVLIVATVAIAIIEPQAQPVTKLVEKVVPVKFTQLSNGYDVSQSTISLNASERINGTITGHFYSLYNSQFNEIIEPTGAYLFLLTQDGYNTWVSSITYQNPEYYPRDSLYCDTPYSSATQNDWWHFDNLKINETSQYVIGIFEQGISPPLPNITMSAVYYVQRTTVNFPVSALNLEQAITFLAAAGAITLTYAEIVRRRELKSKSDESKSGSEVEN